MAQAGQTGPAQDPLAGEVGAFVDAHRLLPGGASLLAGVSGGADSVAMLAVLRELAAEPTRLWRIEVAHLDHALRADSADDAQFVRSLAERWNMPCHVERRDVGELARQTGRCVEDAARMARYEFLAAVARQAGASFVAVAHHADDNAETVLYRLIRGTHLRGLAGMPVRRTLHIADATGQTAESVPTLIRPMLSCRREQIEAYCRRAGLAWRTDSTNADLSYRRNFIRGQLLPLIREKLNPRADEALLRLADSAGQVENFLADLAGELLSRAGRMNPQGCSIDALALAGAHPVLRAHALREALERMGAPMRQVDADHLADLCELANEAAILGGVALPGGFVARRRGSVLVIEKPGANPAQVESTMLQCPGATTLSDGRQIVCQIAPFDLPSFTEHCRTRPPGVELLDADQLIGPLEARPRRDGDSFRPLGSPGRQSVSDFLTNEKLPAALREKTVCIADSLGLVYLAPLRIDDRVKASPATSRVLRIQLRGRW